MTAHEHDYRDVARAGVQYAKVSCLLCGRVWLRDGVSGALEPWSRDHESLFERISAQQRIGVAA